MAGKFTLEIKTGNAAFEDAKEIELVRILRKIADQVENGKLDGLAMDFNGNRVGSYGFEESEVKK